MGFCGEVRAADATAPLLARVPVWVFHGASDSVVPAQRSRSMVAALRRAGGEPRFSEYPGRGHDCWVEAFQEAELLPWLFAQRRG